MELAYKLAYNDAICVIFENVPELKNHPEKLQEEDVQVVFKDFVKACMKLKEADEAFAPCAEVFAEFGNWSEAEKFTPEYWVEFRRLKLEFENAEQKQNDLYHALLDLIEN